MLNCSDNQRDNERQCYYRDSASNPSLRSIRGLTCARCGVDWSGTQGLCAIYFLDNFYNKRISFVKTNEERLININFQRISFPPKLTDKMKISFD